MKQSQQLMFKSIAVFLCLISIGAYGQQQKKTFTESFTVSTDAILDIDTSHADIEFETWNKDQVSIEATIELEGASDEKAKAYFEKEGIEIMGNSKKVTVTTGNENSWAFNSIGNLGDMHIEMPEMPEFESFDFYFDMQDTEGFPPMPPVPNPNFDYDAFEKDGEKYLKEWQKNFQKDFGEPYQKRMEEWREKMEARQEELQAKREKMHEKRMEAQAERMEKRAAVHAKRAETIGKRKGRNQARILRADSIYFSRANGSGMGNRPNIFYFNSGGENKNYKVKKTIKIKMPKSTKIRMNVRHGEVKLAENTKNMNATLSHASLFAATIDGDKTTVRASYSPVSVQRWNYGQLQADYSESVELQEVLNLRLSAVSSDVTIDNLSKTAFIKNSFGPLLINSVAKDFETLDVSLQNAELICKLPNTAFTVYVNGTKSKLVCPARFRLEKTANHGSLVHKGHHIDKNSDRSVTVNATYSEVVLE